MHFRLIDLTHPLSESTPLFPGDKPFLLNQNKFNNVDGYNAYTLLTGLHTGTHIDVPRHYLDDGRMVVDYPPQHFCGHGVLIDVRGQKRIGFRPEYEDLVQPGDAVLLRTGFDAFFLKDSAHYFCDYPTLDDDMGAFLCRKKIGLLGLDTPSPDTEPYHLHRMLLAHDIFLLENLKNLAALADIPAFIIMALPLPIAAEACPVRAVALVD